MSAIRILKDHAIKRKAMLKEFSENTNYLFHTPHNKLRESKPQLDYLQFV